MLVGLKELFYAIDKCAKRNVVVGALVKQVVNVGKQLVGCNVGRDRVFIYFIELESIDNIKRNAI